jgi:UDP-glucose 4-epimerase
MAKYLVTGGAGFIGSNLVEELLKRGERVRVLDNFLTGRKQNLHLLLNDIELIEGDMTQYHVALKAVDGMDFVLHQAALPSVPRSVADPVTSNFVNVNGTMNILHAALEKKVSRLVYASSSSVYGDSPVSPKVETLVPAPKSPYAVSKLTGEYYCRVFTHVYGLETVALRYFNVFGPRQDPASPYSAVIPKFLRAMLRGERPVIYGDGTQSRDFTFVANNVDANLAACTASDVAGKVFNIACGANFTLLELVAALNRILGTNIEPVLGQERTGDIKHSLADISAAKAALGYTPRVSFEEGLARLVAAFEQ